MIVLDASVVVDLLTGVRPQCDTVADAVARWFPSVAVPAHLDAEVGQVLRRFTLRGALTAERGASALDDLADLAFVHVPLAPLAPRAWELRGAITYYDALYVALAEATDGTLLSRDARLARPPGVRARVQVL